MNKKKLFFFVLFGVILIQSIAEVQYYERFVDEVVVSYIITHYDESGWHKWDSRPKPIDITLSSPSPGKITLSHSSSYTPYDSLTTVIYGKDEVEYKISKGETIELPYGDYRIEGKVIYETETLTYFPGGGTDGPQKTRKSVSFKYKFKFHDVPEFDTGSKLSTPTEDLFFAISDNDWTINDTSLFLSTIIDVSDPTNKATNICLKVSAIGVDGSYFATTNYVYNRCRVVQTLENLSPNMVYTLYTQLSNKTMDSLTEYNQVTFIDLFKTGGNIGAGSSENPMPSIPSETLVSGILCRQRYPWNGLVDIDFEIKGLADGNKADLEMFARTDSDMVRITSFETLAPVGLVNGSHRVTWNAFADIGETFTASNVVIRVNAFEVNE